MTFKIRFLVTVACGFAFLAGNSHAVSLINNGSFETTTNGTDKQLGYSTDSQTYKTDATGWTTKGYNFLYSPGHADVGGAANQFNQTTDLLTLWSTANGGLDYMPPSSPDGGNFLALDGAYKVGAVSQVISGLTKGEKYDVSFWWAAAQQADYYGDTTEQLKVSLGAQSFLTNQIALPSRSFSGWMYQTFTFTADSVSPILSFLAIGTPSGLPPFSLVDGVTMQVQPTVIPELSTCLVGAFLACGLAFRRSRKSTLP